MLLQEQLKDKRNFSEAERAIADYVLSRGSAIKGDSGRYIAAQVYTAPSTVVRLCQKLGFKGYNDFKEAWLRELEYLSDYFQDLDANRPFSPSDSAEVIAHRLGALYRETVDDTLTILNAENLSLAVTYCQEAETIYICSGGAQSMIAEAFCEKMAKIGKMVVRSERMDMMFFYACNCKPTDCFIIISYSGETSANRRIAKKLRERKIHTVTMTSFGSNTLTSIFSCNLYMSTRERLVDNLGNFCSHMTALFLLDVLYAGVFNQDYERNKGKKFKNSRQYEIYRRTMNPLIEDKDE